MLARTHCARSALRWSFWSIVRWSLHHHPLLGLTEKSLCFVDSLVHYHRITHTRVKNHWGKEGGRKKVSRVSRTSFRVLVTYSESPGFKSISCPFVAEPESNSHTDSIDDASSQNSGAISLVQLQQHLVHLTCLPGDSKMPYINNENILIIL